MSLINDALRRAQTDVDKGRMRAIPAGLATGRPTRSKNKGSFLVILTVVLIVGIAGWAITILFLIPNENTEASVAGPVLQPVSVEVAPPAVLEAPESVKDPVAVAAAAPVLEKTDLAVEEPVEQVIVQTPPEPTAPVIQTSPLPPQSNISKEEVVQTAKAAVVESVSPPSPPALVLSDEIIFNLKHLDITAVMGEGKNARIMMGGQIFKVGELINLGLKIRFYGKKGTSLYFTDEYGQLYEQGI